MAGVAPRWLAPPPSPGASARWHGARGAQAAHFQGTATRSVGGAFVPGRNTRGVAWVGALAAALLLMAAACARVPDGPGPMGGGAAGQTRSTETGDVEQQAGAWRTQTTREENAPPPPPPPPPEVPSPSPPPPPRKRPEALGLEVACHIQENTELWGAVVREGTDVTTHTAMECCSACRRVAVLDDGSPGCDTWVWCGNRTACGEFYRQCWLKRGDKPMTMEVRARGPDTPWTSGTLFEPLPEDADDIRTFSIAGVGVPAANVRMSDVESTGQAAAVRFDTDRHGSFVAVLRPDLSPQAARAFLNATEGGACASGACNFYRSEAVPKGWSDNGFFGPPYALFQGTLGRARGAPVPLPMEAHPVVRRGHLCVIGAGPDFFVALADHPEWGKAHSVVGFVPSEGMAVVDAMVAAEATRDDTWGQTKVTPLLRPVGFTMARVPGRLDDALGDATLA